MVPPRITVSNESILSFLSLWRLSVGSTNDTPVQVCVAMSSC